ncbi:MAG: hypothetical protein ABII06_13565 [Pseudomonadota bacterium]
MALLLIIDEDIDYCSLLKRWLTRQGHQVMTCTREKEALAWLQNQRPDFVVVSAGKHGERAEKIVSMLKAAGIGGEKILLRAGETSLEAVKRAFAGSVREVLPANSEFGFLESLVSPGVPEKTGDSGGKRA